MKKKILLLGSTGNLGHEFLTTLNPDTVAAPTHKELDLTDADAVNQYLGWCKPDIILNCAAYTSVKSSYEVSPEEFSHGIALNAYLPRRLARYAENNHARLVHFSTDYVFDGTASHFYLEDDVTNPTTVYGTLKRSGEEFITSTTDNALIIRTSALFGGNAPNGKPSFVDHVKRAYDAKKSMAVTSKYTTVPTSIPALAYVVKQHLLYDDLTGIIHATSNGNATWAEFAIAIAKQLKLDGMSFTVVDAPLDNVERPLNPILSTAKLTSLGFNKFLHWKDELLLCRTRL